MRGTNRFELKIVGVALAIALGSCNPTSLDNGSSADSIFEVFNIPAVPPVTSTVDATTTPPSCAFTITNMTVTLRNQGKNSLAGQTAFNDIVVQNVHLTYLWDHPELGLVTNPRTMVLGGTVPAGGNGTVSFPPLALGDLQASYGGHSVNISMLFNGETVAGKAVTATGGAVLSINSCGSASTCAPGTDNDNDGFCDPNDACPNCNAFNCTASTCNVANCSNPNATCTGAFDPPACTNGSDTDGDGVLCPNDACPNCNDVACTGSNPASAHPCNVSAVCTNVGAVCP